MKPDSITYTVRNGTKENHCPRPPTTILELRGEGLRLSEVNFLPASTASYISRCSLCRHHLYQLGTLSAGYKWLGKAGCQRYGCPRMGEFT